MSRLKWGVAGDRFYEAGTDRGVLYVNGNPGVVWNGLTAVKENPSGGSPKPYYVDGYKYLNLATDEEFAASIEAFASPSEFASCDGSLEVYAGLFLTQQRRKSFGLSYRTMLGNDIDGLNHGYKLHLVYNALAAPSTRMNQAVNASPEPTAFSWNITTVAPKLTGHKPCAHFVIDSRYAPNVILGQIESLLYGTDITAPRLPTVQELTTLFSSYLALKLYLVEPDVYAINKVDDVSAFSIISSTKPTASAAGEPILWLDTSVGDYATLKIV